MNMQKMLKEMQKMQGKMSKAQEDLNDQEYNAEAGGGAVKLTMNGQGEVTELSIKEEAVDPEDVEALEDLLMAAFNSGVKQKDDASNNSMSDITSGMKGMPGMPF